MPSNRFVGTGEEPVEFRPLPGQEETWAEFNFVRRSPVWWWLGTLPIGLTFIGLLTLIGVAANG